MSSEDYLMRQFRQLASFLLSITHLRKKERFQEAIDEIDQVLDTWFDMNANKIRDFTADELSTILFEDVSLDFEKEKSIAELLYQKAEVLKEINKKEDSISIAKKSLRIFKELDVISGEFSIEIQQRIVELQNIINGA